MNKLIFFPSLSSGNSRAWLEKNKMIHPDLSCRFYEPNYPTELYHPYFLLSAGHLYRDLDIRNRMGLNDSLVIGDSGGFQISTGALKWDLKLRDQIFLWLEETSDIAMNIDIPPRGMYENRIEEAYQISVDNFKYFASKQTGKTKFLNVLQGFQKSKEFGKKWYDSVKDLEFHGWGFGGPKTVEFVMHLIAFFLQEKELEKKQNKYLHFLGATSPFQMVLFALIQKVLNKHFGDQYIVTTDSSSPNLSTVFGTYYMGIDWKNFSVQSITISKAHKLNLESELPCSLNCKICNGLKYNDIANFDEYQYMVLTHHNMAIFKNMTDFVNRIVYAHDELLQEFLGPKFYKLYLSLEEMFETPNPMRVYNDNALMYRSFGYKDDLQVDAEALKMFFEHDDEVKVKEKKTRKEVKAEKEKDALSNIIPIDNTAIENFFE